MEYSEREYIRKFYLEHFSRILADWPRHSPVISEFRTGIEMTVIEHNLWDSIRWFGLPFYPQYPISWYFVDFADPKLKIAIEVDGRKWHKRNSVKDKKRQKDIEAQGWEVIRFWGDQTFVTEANYIDDDGFFDRDRYFSESADGFMAFLREEYYLPSLQKLAEKQRRESALTF